MSINRFFVKISMATVCCMISVIYQCETANINRIGIWFKMKHNIRDLVDSRADKTDDTSQQRLSFKKSANEDCLTPHELEGQIRLADGQSDIHGRVEIYHDGLWGTVCDDDFTVSAAQVVCRQLGYRGGRVDLEVVGGSGRTWMDGVKCSGTEQRLSSCDFNGWGIEDCSHSEDVGVYCIHVDSTRPPLYEGMVRLVEGRTELEGRLEIYHNHQWGTVCDDSFTATNAEVVCRQLGYSGGTFSTQFPAGSGVTWMDEVNCRGTESRLSDCRFEGWGREDCSHSEDVGVICSDINGTLVQDGDIRLIGGRSNYEGRVEIYHDNQWGTVCDDSWGTLDAQVVCRQLKFTGGIAKTEAYFGRGEEPTWLDEVHCSGSETRLSECRFRGWGLEDCGHSEDAGVVCSPPPTTVETTTQQMEITTAMRGCHNDSMFECYGSGNCIPIDQMCDGEQNCVDGSDENVCRNNDNIISEQGGEVSFVCAASYPTVGKVVSWFHINTETNETELISMDDFIFASNGNFSAHRFNQRVFILKLYGVEERNTGIYECHIDDVEIVAKHQLSLEKGGEGGEPNCASQILNCTAMTDNVEGSLSEICSAAQNFIACVDNLPQQCLVDNNEIQQAIESQRTMFRSLCGISGGNGDGQSTVPPTVEPNEVDCLTESTNCFMLLSSMGHNGDISQMCSISRRFMACAESLPQMCLEGQAELQQSLEQQRVMLDVLCGGNAQTTTSSQLTTTQAPAPPSTPTQEPDEVDCLTESTSCFAILGGIDNTADISVICRVTRRFVGCVESLPQMCLEGQDSLQQSLEQQRNMMNILCGGISRTTTQGPVVSVNVSEEVENGEGGDCNRDAVMRCTTDQIDILANISGPSTDPGVRNQVCSSINEIVTCVQPLLPDCPNVDISALQNYSHVVQYCSPVRNETGDGCKPSDVMECYFHVFKLSKELSKSGHSNICSNSNLQPALTCFKQLPENCLVDQQVRTMIDAFQSSCGNSSQSTPALLTCRFHEFVGKTVMTYPGIAISGSSVWNVDECKRVCENSNCAGFEFDPHESGVGGSCSLFEENSIAAYVTLPNKIFYKKDCAESDETCGTIYETRCKTGECIKIKNICDESRDCPDGSDEVNCGTKSVTLENGISGVVILKFKGKTMLFCDNGSFQQASVNVVCKTLGYRNGFKYTTSHTMVYPDTWALVECEGTETDLFDCPLQDYPDSTCRNQKPVAITCNN